MHYGVLTIFKYIDETKNGCIFCIIISQQKKEQYSALKFVFTKNCFNWLISFLNLIKSNNYVCQRSVPFF